MTWMTGWCGEQLGVNTDIAMRITALHFRTERLLSVAEKARLSIMVPMDHFYTPSSLQKAVLIPLAPSGVATFRILVKILLMNKLPVFQRSPLGMLKPSIFGTR